MFDIYIYVFHLTSTASPSLAYTHSTKRNGTVRIFHNYSDVLGAWVLLTGVAPKLPDD